MDLSTKLIVNLDQLHQNVSNILSYKTGHFMFVVKGNAYSFGYLPIVKELNEYDEIQFLGVGKPNEALYLKPHTDKYVVILGHTPDDVIKDVVSMGVIPTIYSKRQADLLPKGSQVFINVDTGFHRIGGRPEEGFKQELTTLLHHPNISVLGMYTHLTLQNKESDLNQLSLFESTIENITVPYISISDSIAFTRYQTSENLFRIGALMYGYRSSSEANHCNVKPIGTLVSKVIRIMTVTTDTTAYYRSTLKQGTTIATIAIGYGDGLFRTMPEDAYVVINGQQCSYIEVGMEYSIIDITGKDVSMYDTVYIFGGEGLSLKELASLCHTNKNNLLTMITPRVVREYIKNGKIVSYQGLEEGSK